MKRWSRRSALIALGAGGLYGAIGHRVPSARAARGGAKYFIAVYMPHGMARELWQPRAGFDISYEGSVLAPLEPLRQHVVALQGLDLTAGMLASTVGHDASRVLLTGSGSNGRNASLDQFLALEHGLGDDTPLASLVLGVGDARPQLGQCISYARGGHALPKIIDPSQTFSSAFARFIVGDDPVALARAEQERKRGQSLLDYWRADLARLKARAPASERDKLEQHGNALRELEKRLSSSGGDCQVPATPDPEQFPRLSAYQGGEPYFDVITDLQIDLLAQAMACGVTRVATLFLADLSRTGLDPDLPEDVHIDVAHTYDASSRDGKGGNPESWARLGRQNRYTYGKVARLLQRLAELQLLEDTVLVAQSDMGDTARHTSSQIPTVLAGGWGGALRGERHIDLGATGTPNNRLLVSMQQAFGVESDRYGDSADETVLTGALDLS